MCECKSIEKVSDKKETFELKQRELKALASSDLLPKQYQGNIANCMIAKNLADRIGADVFAVMQHLYIVHGRPAFDATFLISTVNASGKFTPIRYKFEGQQGKDSWGCRAYATDKDTGEVCTGPLVTIEMSKKEGWYSKNGSKWQTLPELMLCYRSASFWTRIYCPELSMGMHTVEEVVDTMNASAVRIAPVSTLEELTNKIKAESDIDEINKIKEEDGQDALNMVY